MENDFAVHCCTVFSECEMHLFSSSMMEKYCACFLLLAPSAPAFKLWRFLPLLCNNTLLFYSRCFWSDQGSTPKFLSFLWRTVLAFQNSFGADTTSVSSFLSWTHFFFSGSIARAWLFNASNLFWLFLVFRGGQNESCWCDIFPVSRENFSCLMRQTLSFFFVPLAWVPCNAAIPTVDIFLTQFWRAPLDEPNNDFH